MKICKVVTKIFLILATAASVFSADAVSAAQMIRQDEAVLLDSYRSNLARLQSNNFGLPLYVESFERDDRVHVDVYGIFDQSFSSIADNLKVPANWCDIVSLHTNVKACTYSELDGTWLLNFYLGRKSYQSPEDATRVATSFRNVEHDNYLDVMLAANDGPYGTKNHKMRCEAMPLEDGRTFMHVSYDYRNSATLRLASKVYFATLGHGKVGFTVTGKDKTGKAVYIGGPRGALERSAVRYYFAIKSFMNTLHYPEESRFSVRIGEWYTLTSRYPEQLADVDKKDYLALKTREHANQLMLQQLIEARHQ